MEHFSVEKWIDFVNRAVTTNEKQKMDKHLSLGCESCQKTVSLWQRVRSSAATERNYCSVPKIVGLSRVCQSSVRMLLISLQAAKELTGQHTRVFWPRGTRRW
jgi:hypothetical protein